MKIAFTWDDGAPEDLKLMELHRKYEIPGMFFIPNRNSEGRKVLSPSQIQNNASELISFGGHTENHVYLTGVSLKCAEREAVNNKYYLEDLLGKKTDHFCLPGGAYTREILQVIYKYYKTIRTADTMSFICGERLCRPSFHVYPRGIKSLIGNAVRNGSAAEGMYVLRHMNAGYFQIIRSLISECMVQDKTVVVWGHSWEIEEKNLWGWLEEVMKEMSEKCKKACVPYDELFRGGRMRLLIINEVCGIGSHGKICTAIAQSYEKMGAQVKIAYGRDDTVPEEYKKYALRIGNKTDVYRHAIYTRITDKHGFASKKATREFLKQADRFKPDLLWLHNLHGYYLNIQLLFEWIRKHKPAVKWTLHDCWAFTGHCAHFTEAGCGRWKSGCHHCPQKNAYPASWLCDRSAWNYMQKKKLFTGIRNMTLITPSQWLKNLAEESFLAEYPIEVHYNTIDTNVFRPLKSNFRKEYGLESKKIVLGVSAVWNHKKGLYDFYELASMLDESYVIVLVGLTEKQIKKLHDDVIKWKTPKVCKGTSGEKITNRYGGAAVPMGAANLYEAVTGKKFVKGNGRAGIVGLRSIRDAGKLAEIYSAADVFVNATHEDNYPTVNLEAAACGTRVVTYDVGGCRETICRADTVQSGS